MRTYIAPHLLYSVQISHLGWGQFKYVRKLQYTANKESDHKLLWVFFLKGVCDLLGWTCRQATGYLLSPPFLDTSYHKDMWTCLELTLCRW